MGNKRQKIVNNAFADLLSVGQLLGGVITEAARYESGWIRVKCRHEETGLKFEITFDIEKVTEENNG